MTVWELGQKPARVPFWDTDHLIGYLFWSYKHWITKVAEDVTGVVLDHLRGKK